LPASESFALNAKIYGVDDTALKATVKEMTALLGVADKLDISVRELSLGERAKMELIASLLHKPKVLFLDEPTIGLDVVSQKAVREFLRQHNATQHTTILLTSHYMADIEQLCQRVIIIDHGEIFFDGGLSDVVDRFADSKVVTLQCGETDCPAERLAKYGEILEQHAGIIQLKVKRDRVISVCKALLDEMPVTDIDIQEVPIEEVIRRIFAR
jgi:ABC-2 type transport system ATP-binding protein